MVQIDCYPGFRSGRDDHLKKCVLHIDEVVEGELGVCAPAGKGGKVSFMRAVIGVAVARTSEIERAQPWLEGKSAPLIPGLCRNRPRLVVLVGPVTELIGAPQQGIDAARTQRLEGEQVRADGMEIQVLVIKAGPFCG